MFSARTFALRVDGRGNPEVVLAISPGQYTNFLRIDVERPSRAYVMRAPLQPPESVYLCAGHRTRNGGSPTYWGIELLVPPRKTSISVRDAL